MHRLVLQTVILNLVLVLIFSGCGPAKPSVNSTGRLYTKNISDWVGTYTGTVVYTYGDITDRKGNEGFPATLVLREIPGEILFDLTTHHNKTVWLFFLPPSMFTSKSIEFIRNVPFKGTEYQFRIAITLADERLTGTMKMFSRLQDGTLKRRGAYFLSFTKLAR